MKTSNEVKPIDATPIIEFITTGLNEKDKTKNFGYDGVRILTEIEHAPTIDAEPVRHGYWIAFNVIDIKDCSFKIRYMCNKCGRYEDEQEPYCNCGAKMDVVSE